MNRRPFSAAGRLAAGLLALGASVAPTDAGARVEDLHLSTTELPEPLVRVPVACAPGSPAGDRSIVQLFVEEQGFVGNVRFVPPAPADSARFAASLRRWIFRPARAGDGRPVAVWIAVPVTRDCAREPRLLERPDSLLRARLEHTAFVTARRLLPPEEASLDSVRRSGRRPELHQGSWVLDTAVDSSGAAADSLLALLEDPAAYGGREPAEARCPPEPELALTLSERRTGAASAEVLIDFGCDFMQVRSAEGVLFVPFGPARRRVLALARSLFPGDPAFAPPGPVPSSRAGSRPGR